MNELTKQVQELEASRLATASAKKACKAAMNVLCNRIKAECDRLLDDPTAQRLGLYSEMWPASKGAEDHDLYAAISVIRRSGGFLGFGSDKDYIFIARLTATQSDQYAGIELKDTAGPLRVCTRNVGSEDATDRLFLEEVKKLAAFKLALYIVEHRK